MHRTWLTPQEFHRRNKMWKKKPPPDPFNQYENAWERVKKEKIIMQFNYCVNRLVNVRESLKLR